MKKKKLSFLLIILVLVLAAGTVTTLAIEYSGEAGGGTESAITGDATSFCLLHADKGCAASQVIGYRFTIVDCQGNQRGETIDVYRNQYTSVSCANCDFSGIVFWNEYGYNGCSLLDGQGKAMSKLKLRASAQNGNAFSLAKTKQNRYKESDLDKNGTLPLAQSIGSWIRCEKNYETVCLLCTGYQGLNYGDTILMEPIFACRVEDLCCGLTGSDLARLAFSYYGDEVPSGVSGGYSFAWLRKWVHKEFPNVLSVTERSYARLLGLEPGRKLVSMAKPSTILNSAYAMAVGVELSEAQKPTLAVERIEIYQGTSLVQAYDADGSFHLNTFLNADTAYTFRVYYSEEDSRYRVNRTLNSDSENQLTQSFSTDIYTDFPIILDAVTEEMSFSAREEWVSDRGNLILRGEEKNYVFYGAPLINSGISLYDLHGTEIPAAYLGQEVQTRYHLDMAFETRRNISIEGRVNGTVVLTGASELLPGEQKTLWGDSIQVTQPNTLSCILDCRWEKDLVHSPARIIRNFPVAVPDLEVTDFYLTDAAGKLINPADAPADVELTPVVVVRNNTAVGLYADFFLEEETFYTRLEAGETYIWTCKPRLITPGDYELCAEAYIECQNKTSVWESDPDNNVRWLLGKAKQKITASFGDNEATYHENIDVYLNAFFQNDSNENYKNAIARIRVLDRNGKELFLDTYLFDSPAGTKSLVYCQWHTRKNGAKVVIDFSRDGGVTYTHRLEKAISVAALSGSQTPDTRYESCGRVLKTTNAAKQEQKLAGIAWTKWTLDKETTTAVNEYVTVKGLTSVLSPKNQVLKSGYSFKADFHLNITGLAPLCTGVQNAYVLYPEYDYEMTWQKFDRLSLSDETFSHFTPLWFPDGDYTYLLVLDDIWTPMGRITLTLPGTLSIRGNLYDDWIVTK